MSADDDYLEEMKACMQKKIIQIWVYTYVDGGHVACQQQLPVLLSKAVERAKYSK